MSHPRLFMGAQHAGSKWIDGITAEQSVAAAAHRALELRLGVVWELMPAAAYAADQDAEHVHQLRVASRRADAALRFFSECLPPHRAKKIGKLLRRVRRAAGEARDYDVQRARLAALDSSGVISTQSVLPFVDRRRAAAQAPIVEIYEQLRQKDFLKRVAKLLQRLEARDDAVTTTPFGAYAAERLRRVADGFFAAEAGSQDGYQALHLFRIRTKAMRYTLELLASLWGDTMRHEIYPIVEALQERLGQIVDTHVAMDLYQRWSRKGHCDGSRCAWRSLVAHQQSQLDEQLAGFDQHWTPERSEDLRQRLRELAQLPLPSGGSQHGLAGSA